jgi:uracil-DNA glycosylase
MSNGNREQNIRRIIEMEDRICMCQRCLGLAQCVRKPSLGKGDLDPVIMLVFESENPYTGDLNKIIELRNIIKNSSETEKIYHTYMVRCCPKSCSTMQNTTCYLNTKLLDKDYNCALSHSKCNGIPIKPHNEDIISCLPFLLEEIEILKPRYIFMFGKRVSEFLLRSYGIFDDIEIGASYKHENIILLATVEENLFTESDLEKFSF